MPLLLVLCLFGLSLGQKIDPEIDSHFKIPVEGYPDGSILTFYFKHIEGPGNGKVRINMYDKPNITDYVKQDINAHIRIDDDKLFPVATNSLFNRVWQKETKKEQPLVGRPPRDGWWRLDVVKFSEHELNIFFQGYWSDIRRFDGSLDHIQSIYVSSEDVDHNNLYVFYTPPDTHLMQWLNRDAFIRNLPAGPYHENPTHFWQFPHFKVGDFLHVSAFLRAKAGGDRIYPLLTFATASGEEIFDIKQKVSFAYFMMHTDLFIDSYGSQQCTSSKDTGDLEHLRIQRSGTDKIYLALYYQNGYESVTCKHKVHGLEKLEDGFKIIGSYGALPINMRFNQDNRIPLNRQV